MSYGYSLRLVRLNREADPSKLGVQLGRLCIEHDIPVTEVARRFKVTRVTVYNWFCGDSSPRPNVVPLLEAYIADLAA